MVDAVISCRDTDFDDCTEGEEWVEAALSDASLMVFRKDTEVWIASLLCFEDSSFQVDFDLDELFFEISSGDWEACDYLSLAALLERHAARLRALGKSP